MRMVMMILAGVMMMDVQDVVAEGEGDGEVLYVVEAVTAEGSFNKGIEGPAVDRAGNIYAVGYGEGATIGKVSSRGDGELFLTMPNGSVGNGIRFDRTGKWMFVADYKGHNVLKVAVDTQVVEVFAHDERMNQPNDIAITNEGVIFASDPNWRDGTGQVWRIEKDGKTVLLEKGMGTTNGIEVSPDGKQLYVNESVQRRVWVYDLNEHGDISHKRLLIEFPDHGLDGMRCDVDGLLYVTRYGKGTVAVIDEAGEVVREIEVGGKRVSNVAFGGEDGRTVYVTVVDRGRLEKFRVARPGRSFEMWDEDAQ
ncbi:SMP-30/gluconolactonase/LRE family protein [Poriferisphaera sp. WC338]|uniref:SMP-30/gluconolactonase/LRE family protein n=1 Tax=Poriferisphaera sp. WC338 TaxID=3425129 RepID=UPI003D8192DD